MTTYVFPKNPKRRKQNGERCVSCKHGLYQRVENGKREHYCEKFKEWFLYHHWCGSYEC